MISILHGVILLASFVEVETNRHSVVEDEIVLTSRSSHYVYVCTLLVDVHNVVDYLAGYATCSFLAVRLES